MPNVEKDSWQYRAIAHTMGNSTPLGCLLLAVIGRNAKHPPWFGLTAEITAEGLVVTSFTHRSGARYDPWVFGPVEELTAAFSRLADELKLNDADRIELFRQVRQWVARDHRRDIRLHFTAGG